MTDNWIKNGRKHDTGRLSERILTDSLASRAETPDVLRVIYYDTVGSTNTEAKLMAIDGIPTLLVAEEQTGGRGRTGKSFLCPRGDGVYMSLLIYPKLSAREALGITAYTAVVARRAIERVCGVSAGIKWVNDLYLGGKKVAGILTEGRADAESGMLDFAVVGIGINLHESDLGELNEIATSIEGEGGTPTDRITLITEIIAEFFACFDDIGTREIAAEYARHSVIEGRRITVTKGDTVTDATALAVGEDLRLLIRTDDGRELWLDSGDVSLKLK